ncbi:MAG: superinfection immunity protein [Pseudomonadota bacterium]
MGGISIWQLLIFITIFLPLIFLPSIIAISKNHPHRLFIILLNVFGGMVFGIGWIIALIWSLMSQSTLYTTNIAKELERLHELKVKGIITAEEFEKRKRRLI